jgi:hypothetical protein
MMPARERRDQRRSADLFLYSAARSTVAPRSSLLAFAFRRCSDTYVHPTNTPSAAIKTAICRSSSAV